MNPRLDRVAKNEAVFRAVNREIERVSEELGSIGELEVLCECGRDGCDALLSLSVSDYERAHFQDDRFVLAPGHETPEIERVVERREGYVIVDKFGEAEEIVEGR